jgi:GTP-binding protein HflX
MSQMGREQIRVAAERAVLVRVVLPHSYLDPRDPFSELRALSETAGARVVGELIQKRSKPHMRTYLGKGKVEELAHLVKTVDATLIIFDHDLSPAQIRNIEQETECKVIDRSELILDIFANRATTHMAKLQVETRATGVHLPAPPRHVGPPRAASSAARRWASAPAARASSRSKSTAVSSSACAKAMNCRRIDTSSGGSARSQQRKPITTPSGSSATPTRARARSSTRVTAGGAFANDKLFATLSTRIERWELGGGDSVMLSDTVGFIRDLPHHLVASFKSTLEETVQAQMLIVLVDVSDPNAEMQLQTVQATLDEIGADHGKRLIALNKMDALPHAADQLVWLNRHPEAIPISAKTGLGIEEIQAIVLDQMLGGVMEVTISLPTRDGRSIDYLEKRTEVLDRTYLEGRLEARVRIGRRHVESLLARGGEFTIDGLPPREALDTIWPSEPVLVTTRIPPHVRVHDGD